jgi:hypothetical protein
MHRHENHLVEEKNEREIHYTEIGKYAHTKLRRFIKETVDLEAVGGSGSTMKRNRKVQHQLQG